MLKFKSIEIGDKKLFEKYTLCHGYHNIEASFANIYLWRKAWGISMAADEDAMYLHMDNGAEASFMLPPFLRDCDINMSGPLKKCEEYLKNEEEATPLIKGVTAMIKNKIENDCPGEYLFTPDRDNFDYVYNSEDLCMLRGKKYHAKRNHINSLIKEHSYEYESYSDEYYEPCIKLQQQWIENKEEFSQGYEEELFVTKEALSNLDTLGLKCGLLFVDGKLEAFSIGEKFDKDMAIIHIEKANPNVQGSYPLINREFVKNEWCDIKYINREEDMGIEGLRRAKLSYNPVFLIEKFDCVRR